jgi:hypothetical protein
MSATAHATGRAAARFGGALVRLGVLVLAVMLTSVAAGQPVAAIAAASLVMVAGVRWWARVEARLFAPPQPTTKLGGRPARIVDEHGHLAFAQALALLAARYLAECEAKDASPNHDPCRADRTAPRRQGPRQ